MALEGKGAEMCSLTAVLERVIIKLGTAELLLLFPQVLHTLTRANTLRALPATNHAAVKSPVTRKGQFYNDTIKHGGSLRRKGKVRGNSYLHHHG